MEFLQSWISPPRADHVQIAKYIIIVTSLFFIPYISVLFGSTLFSLGFSLRGKYEENSMFSRFSKDLVNMLYGNWGVAVVLGILPLITLTISFSQVLYGTDANIAQYFSVALLNVIVAIVITFLYRKSFETRDDAFVKHVILGVLALGGLKMTLFAFSSTVTLVLFPERWPLIDSIIPLTFDWSVVAKFSFLMTLSFAITGAAILFFFFSWAGGKQDMDEKYRDYVKKFGAGITLGLSIVSMLMFLWYLVTLPVMAKSYPMFLSAMLAVFVMLIVCFYAYALLRDSQLKHAGKIFVLFMVFFLVVVVNDNFARESSLHYQNYKLDKINSDIIAKIEAQRAENSGVAASVESGKEIYTNKCIACHRFDQKLVGPAYNDVIPKYNGDLEKLKQFILNPVKVDPSFPMTMPNQGLKPVEAESVAMYLLDEVKKLQGN